MTDIKQKVIQIITEQLGVSSDKVLDSATMSELGADSLDTVELIMALEEAFEIEIPDSDSQAMKTVKDVFEYVEKVKK